MSQENVEVVRRFYEAWNRREEETQTEAFAPEIELRPLVWTRSITGTRG
jgi:ketosteroid isomerase-like protein